MITKMLYMLSLVAVLAVTGCNQPDPFSPKANPPMRWIKFRGQFYQTLATTPTPIVMCDTSEIFWRYGKRFCRLEVAVRMK